MDKNFVETVKENFVKQIKELDEQEKFLLVEEQIKQVSGDEMDLISNGLESDFLFKLHNRNKFLRKKIFYALEKIADGTYGSCEECNQKIGMGRLLARPTATMCIQCKEGQEKEELSTSVRDLNPRWWKIETGSNSESTISESAVKAIRQGEI